MSPLSHKDLVVLYNSPTMLLVNKRRPFSENNREFIQLLENCLQGKIYAVGYHDPEVTGIGIFAKRAKATSQLLHLLSKNQVRKEFFAVVHGKFKRNQNKITTKIGTRAATTKINSVFHLRNYSLLTLCQPTNCKQQIRQHLAEAGFPIVGDRKFNQRKGVNCNLMLHFSRVKFAFKEGVYDLSAKLPFHFSLFLKQLGYQIVKFKA